MAVGSLTVLIGGLPAVRMGDTIVDQRSECHHAGALTVLIG